MAELVDVILPNHYESRQLFGETTPGEWAEHTATAVIAKSASSTEEDVTDKAISLMAGSSRAPHHASEKTAMAQAVSTLRHYALP